MSAGTLGWFHCSGAVGIYTGFARFNLNSLSQWTLLTPSRHDARVTAVVRDVAVQAKCAASRHEQYVVTLNKVLPVAASLLVGTPRHFVVSGTSKALHSIVLEVLDR